jgi:prolyl 4-hydroxylase
VKRTELAAAARAPHFIGSWFVEPAEVCDDLIALFENARDRHQPGMTYHGLNEAEKKSTDLTVYPRDLGDEAFAAARRYIDTLHECYMDYLKQWPFLERLGAMNIGPFNIQRYDAGGHFGHLHAERVELSNSHRVLTWMTYLNDVSDGGSTYFPHFDVDIRPEKAKTIIWPAEWTHAHVGNKVTTGPKYIITGWLHFPS